MEMAKTKRLSVGLTNTFVALEVATNTFSTVAKENGESSAKGFEETILALSQKTG